MTDTVKASCTLGGREIIVTGEPIQWVLRPGTAPSTQTFSMAPDDAKALLGGPHSLVIKPLEGATVKVDHLWVRKVMPGDVPYLSRVLVSDRRWFWPRKRVLVRCNMRRNVGTKRILANDKELQGVGDRAEDIAYWRYSLQSGGQKHTPQSMLVETMSQVAEAEKAYHGQTFSAVLDDRVGSKISGLPIEEFQIDEAGDDAVARAVLQLPEAAVTVDYDGTVIIFSRACGDEIQIVQALMPEIWMQGHTDLVKNTIERPKEVHVLYTREVEVRHDFKEVAKSQGQTVTDEPLGEKRLLANVIPLPDYELTINGRTFPQDSWVFIDDAMRSWGNLPILNKPIDHDLLQRAFIPQMDLWSAIGVAGETPNGTTLKPWVARIAACQMHYRTTFQINSQWMDRSFSIRAYRLATINPQTGQRGPSMAYGDYCILPSQRHRYRNLAEGKPQYYAVNQSAYPTGANEYLDSTALPSPGVVSIEDHDQGILHVDYAIDRNRTYEMVLPSQMVLASMPKGDVTQTTNPIAFNDVVDATSPPRLSPSFKLAIIITHVPASPNSTQQLHRIVVKPQDVANLLPEAAQAGLNDAQGPIMEIRIGPGLEVARIRWLDSAATTIEHVFGIDTATGAEWKAPTDPAGAAAFSQEVSKLCMNEGSTGGKAGASLNEIARAQAASVYASFVDRYEGSMTGHMNGNVHLAGWVTEITHSYGARSETLTSIHFPAQLPAMSLFSFLSASERAVVLKLVQP